MAPAVLRVLVGICTILRATTRKQSNGQAKSRQVGGVYGHRECGRSGRAWDPIDVKADQCTVEWWKDASALHRTWKGEQKGCTTSTQVAVQECMRCRELRPLGTCCRMWVLAVRRCTADHAMIRSGFVTEPLSRGCKLQPWVYKCIIPTLMSIRVLQDFELEYNWAELATPYATSDITSLQTVGLNLFPNSPSRAIRAA
ncbi:hypothetical protein BDZ91DRAFT_764800 [Kalaharituber pfeilii]|nr:hypothetical protein BDZ91DRAFT_764800 [Kalaharituber pfeilii]